MALLGLLVHNVIKLLPYSARKAAKWEAVGNKCYCLQRVGFHITASISVSMIPSSLNMCLRELRLVSTIFTYLSVLYDVDTGHRGFGLRPQFSLYIFTARSVA